MQPELMFRALSCDENQENAPKILLLNNWSWKAIADVS